MNDQTLYQIVTSVTLILFTISLIIGALSTVAGLFITSRMPRLTMMVGYDPRFSHGDYGIFVECTAEDAEVAETLLRNHGAVEVRSER